jgi:lysophospholipase L1-like esterase
MIENVLWRIQHGELDGFTAEQVVLMIGTNNLFSNSQKEIVEGLIHLIDAVRIRQPDSRIVLAGLLPRRGKEKAIQRLNLKIARMAELENVHYIDLSGHFLLEDGTLNESLFADGLHPNKEGYWLIAKYLQCVLQECE